MGGGLFFPNRKVFKTWVKSNQSLVSHIKQILECVHWTNAIKLKTVRPLFSLQPRWKLIKLKNKTKRFIGHFDGERETS